MINYNDIEKQQIMLMSDLLSDSMTLNEIIQLRKFSNNTNHIIQREDIEHASLDCELKNKVISLLAQGLKLGVRLEQLSQRGIKILFPTKLNISTDILNRFNSHPNLLFTIGNINLFTNNDIKIIDKYLYLKQCSNVDKIIFIADRNFDTLLRYNDISKRLMDGNLLMISDSYHSKTNLKHTDKQENRPLRGTINKKVFISGSRSQVVIPQIAQNSLDLIRKQNIEVLIGDSEKGVDNEIIDYFRLAPSYPSLTIFTIKQKARVKVENEWDTKSIETDPSLKPQARQMMKDRAMADEADWGLAIFKPIILNRYKSIQVSSGTLRNSIQLLLNKKAVKFFYLYENEIQSKDLKSITDLEEIIEQYKNEKLSHTEIGDILSARGIKAGTDPAVEKYNKINKKFLELLKNERKLLNLTNTSHKNSPMVNQLSIFN